MLPGLKDLRCRCGGTPFADWSGDTLHLQCPKCHRGVAEVKKRSESMEDLADRIAEGSAFYRGPESKREDAGSTINVALP